MKSFKLFFLFFLFIFYNLYSDNYIFIYFNTDSYFFNNSDFRSYNSYEYSLYKSDQTKNTDDAVFFIYSNVGLRLSKRLNNTFFYIDIYTSGFWGNDNLETNNYNSLMLKEVYFDYYFKNLSLRIGRQRFSFGSIQDYFFYDIVDGFLISYRDLLNFTYSFDVLGIANKPEGYLYSSIKKDDKNINDFRGKRVSFRTGVILDYLFIKTFMYYVYFGANKAGGADISENGLNNLNKPDNDFLFLSGLRLYRDWIDFTIAYSYGKDYKIDTEFIYNGIGSVVNVVHSFNYFSTYLGLGYFSSDFCGFKGISPGDILLYGYKGYFSSAYVGSYHFVDYERDGTFIDSTRSKAFIKLVNSFNYFSLTLKLKNTLLFDTKIKKFMGIENILESGLKFDEVRLNIFLGFYLPYYKYYRIIENSFISSGKDIFYSFGFKISYILFSL